MVMVVRFSPMMICWRRPAVKFVCMGRASVITIPGLVLVGAWIPFSVRWCLPSLSGLTGKSGGDGCLGNVIGSY